MTKSKKPTAYPKYYPKTKGRSMLYIKPLRRKHESGFRIMEVGYIGFDSTKREVLGECSDNIHTDFKQLYSDLKIPINMDCTMDGYIRMWGSEKHELYWKYPIMSSAEITTERA